MTNHVFSDKARWVFTWLFFIVSNSLPFSSFVEKPSLRGITKGNINPISRSSLMKYMHLVAEEMYKNIARVMPKLFGIIFDGWSDNGNNDTDFLFVNRIC